MPGSAEMRGLADAPEMRRLIQAERETGGGARQPTERHVDGRATRGRPQDDLERPTTISQTVLGSTARMIALASTVSDRRRKA